VFPNTTEMLQSHSEDDKNERVGCYSSFLYLLEESSAVYG
jgi:hypothetical protein